MQARRESIFVMRIAVRTYLSVVLAGVLIAACGSSSSSSSRRPKRASAAASAEAQIKRNWAAFFSPSTSVTEKEALLQNGQQFAPIITGMSTSPLAKGVSATVTEVKLTGPTTASVVYTLSLGGRPVLKHTSGTAVKSGSSWLVGDVSFCQLLKLEGSTPPGCPKA